MAVKHAVHAHITQCPGSSTYKVYVVIPAGATAQITDIAVGEPDNDGISIVLITIDADQNAASIFLERSFEVSDNARFIQIELNGQSSYRPYYGCNIDLGLYDAGDLDTCDAGDVICDTPYIASKEKNVTKTKYLREVLIKQCNYNFIVNTSIPNGKSVDVVLRQSGPGDGSWLNIPIGEVTGALAGDYFAIEAAGDPPKKRKTKIPVTGHIVHPRPKSKPKQK